MQPRITDKMDNLFGFGWKSLYADAMGISKDSVTRMNENTETAMTAVYEFMSETDPLDWPDRWSQLGRLRKIMVLRSELIQLGG